MVASRNRLIKEGIVGALVLAFDSKGTARVAQAGTW